MVTSVPHQIGDALAYRRARERRRAGARVVQFAASEGVNASFIVEFRAETYRSSAAVYVLAPRLIVRSLRCRWAKKDGFLSDASQASAWFLVLICGVTLVLSSLGWVSQETYGSADWRMMVAGSLTIAAFAVAGGAALLEVRPTSYWFPVRLLALFFVLGALGSGLFNDVAIFGELWPRAMLLLIMPDLWKGLNSVGRVRSMLRILAGTIVLGVAVPLAVVLLLPTFLVGLVMYTSRRNLVGALVSSLSAVALCRQLFGASETATIAGFLVAVVIGYFLARLAIRVGLETVSGAKPQLSYERPMLIDGAWWWCTRENVADEFVPQHLLRLKTC